MKKSLIIVLVIGVIIFGGLFYLFWNQSKNQQATETAQNLPLITKSKSTKSSQQKPEDAYLVIKEWNVRFRLTDGIKDARVVYSDGEPYGLTTATVEKIEGCKNAEIRSLRRAKIDEDIAYEYPVRRALNEKADWLIHIDDYYYALFNAGWSCTQDREGQQKIMETIEELHNAFVDTLEAAN